MSDIAKRDDLFRTKRPPADLDECTQWVHQEVAIGKRAAMSIAVLIAYAKDHFFPDVMKWRLWAKDEYGYEKRHCYTCLKAGRLILEFAVRHPSLSGCAVHKLEEISRIWEKKPDHIDAWLQHVDINALTREELRLKVNAYLDEKPKVGKSHQPPKEPPKQLDFFAALDAVCNIDDDERIRILEDTAISPLDTALSGLTLVDISLEKLAEANSFTPEQYEALINDLENKLEAAKDLAVQVSPVPLLNA